MKKKIEKVKAKTVLQRFADWLATGSRERDEKFTVQSSERTIVIIRVREK
jgi:hypothetical protein